MSNAIPIGTLPIGQAARDPYFAVCSISACLATRALDLTRAIDDQGAPRAANDQEFLTKVVFGGACLGLVALAALVEACFRMVLAVICMPIACCILSREHVFAKSLLCTISILGETASMDTAKIAGRAFLHNLFREPIPDFDVIATNLEITPWEKSVDSWGRLVHG